MLKHWILLDVMTTIVWNDIECNKVHPNLFNVIAKISKLHCNYVQSPSIVYIFKLVFRLKKSSNQELLTTLILWSMIEMRTLNMPINIFPCSLNCFNYLSLFFGLDSFWTWSHSFIQFCTFYTFIAV